MKTGVGMLSAKTNFRKVLRLFVVCLCLRSLGVSTHAAVLFKEDFEGTNSMSTYNARAWITIPAFTSSTWKNYLGILKNRSVPHSGKQCAQLYGEADQWETSEMYSGHSQGRTEIWVSWWERLSPDYHIDLNHKWFLVSLQDTGKDYYTSFQCNNGGADTTARMRIYSEPLDILYGATNMLLPTNTWYQLKVHYKLNTPGLSGGSVGTWIRKSAHDHWQPWHDFRGINMRGTGTNAIDSIRFGGTRSGYPSRGIKYIDDIIVATTEAEVDGVKSIR